MSEPDPSAIKVGELHVKLGAAEVLAGVSMDARAGQILAIIGPNGAGKSTLARAIAGLLPYRGRIDLGGQDAASLELRERATTLAFVPQRSQLASRLPVRSVIEQGRYPHRRGFGGLGDGDQAAVDRAIARARVEPLCERSYLELSHGEQRRVLLARALATEAPVLLLDEPTASLDIAQVLSLYRTLRELAAEGRAVVVVLHALDDARRFADRALLLDRGRVVAEGPCAEVICARHVAEVYGVRLLEEASLGYESLPEGPP
ncbi:MAG: ABC transporter ATP-binding protein [Myxococcales bacterium]|nr:ABC transporter ATP-binding protein [Myxococcales bacterium]